MRLRGVRLVSFAPAGHSPSSPVDLTVDGGVVTDISPASHWGGRWVMPGLVDHHVHIEQWARTFHRLDLAGALTPEQSLDLVARASGAGPDGVLIGVNLWHSRWEHPFGSPGGPTRGDLDRVSGDMPTVLISADLHSAWFNTAAMHKYSAPVDAGGASTGLVAEGPWFEILPLLDAVGEEELDSWVGNAARAAAARGVTGIVDFEFTDTLTAWRRRIDTGFDLLRVRAAVWPEHLEAAIRAGLRTDDLLDAGSDLLTMGPLKIISDGSLNTRTAWCHAPYPDGTFGLPNLTGTELRTLMDRATRAGIHAAIHAIGDRANEVALDAFAATGAKGSVEHAQLLTARDVTRFAELGVAASVQPAHLLDDRDTAEQLWAGQTDRAYMFASLLEAGAQLTFGSDAPVAPLDPWLAIHAAITRTADDRPAWHPPELLDRRAALRASVAHPSIEVGQAADLVVLGADPLQVGADELLDIPVLQTLCAGRVTHSA